MRRILAIIATVCLILAQIPASAEGTVWRLVTEEGAVLTHVCYEPEQGDQYGAGDRHVRAAGRQLAQQRGGAGGERRRYTAPDCTVLYAQR